MSDLSFEDELNVLGDAVGEATQVFYTYLSIHQLLENRVDMRDFVNSNLLFMRTLLGSLRASTYIFIYKIFETREDTYNLKRLMNAARHSMDEFGPEAFCARKVKHNFRNTPLWLKDQVKDMYIPTLADFDELDNVGEKWRILFKAKFKDQRNKWYSHREFCSDIDASARLPETTVEEVELLLAYLNNLHHGLWQLYHNARKIDISTLSTPSIQFGIAAPQARTKQATDLFFGKVLTQ
ncbi:MAG TPA: hypothetical protein VKV22_03725 [Rhodanobacteraceae bacterium]|nr:hypothetical protein [Rhodanobacteraceae bacterium]